MNYQFHYDRLVETRKNRKLEENVYYEEHHILPRSMGGSNDPENLVMLTAREHFLAHWLLWRIFKNRQTAFAFHAMKFNKRKKEYEFLSSRLYAEAREASNFATKEMHKSGKYAYTEERKMKLRNNPNSLWGKEAQSKSSRAKWKKYTPEERSEMQSNANKKAWQNMTEEERKRRQDAMQSARKMNNSFSAATAKGWAKLTEEERKERGRKISEGRKKSLKEKI